MAYNVYGQSAVAARSAQLYLGLLPNVRESKTVLDSGFQTMDSGFFANET